MHSTANYICKVMARIQERPMTGDAASQLSIDRPADMMSGDVNYTRQVTESRDVVHI